MSTHLFFMRLMSLGCVSNAMMLCLVCVTTVS